uniref:Uncharacterized protein n=1 Tax=Parascaris equorum TaxID=6256 RepID=A0A914R4Y5_PAREQ
MLYNTLELCAMGGSLGTSLGGSQSILLPRRGSQVAQQHSQASINSSMLMSDTSSASNIGSTTGNMFNSRPSLGSFLSSLGGTCGGTLTQQHCSSLRDEGVGESPSFRRFGGVQTDS